VFQFGTGSIAAEYKIPSSSSKDYYDHDFDAAPVLKMQTQDNGYKIADTISRQDSVHRDLCAQKVVDESKLRKPLQILAPTLKLDCAR
jgi:hypothetical protein